MQKEGYNIKRKTELIQYVLTFPVSSKQTKKLP